VGPHLTLNPVRGPQRTVRTQASPPYSAPASGMEHTYDAATNAMTAIDVKLPFALTPTHGLRAGGASSV